MRKTNKSLLLIACVHMFEKGYSEDDVIEMLKQYGYTSKQRNDVMQQAKMEFEKRGKPE